MVVRIFDSPLEAVREMVAGQMAVSETNPCHTPSYDHSDIEPSCPTCKYKLYPGSWPTLVNRELLSFEKACLELHPKRL